MNKHSTCEDCQVDSRGMWSHRTAIDQAAVVEAYPALCQPVQADPSARREGCAGSVLALTPLGELWRRHS